MRSALIGQGLMSFLTSRLCAPTRPRQCNFLSARIKLLCVMARNSCTFYTTTGARSVARLCSKTFAELFVGKR